MEEKKKGSLKILLIHTNFFQNLEIFFAKHDGYGLVTSTLKLNNLQFAWIQI